MLDALSMATLIEAKSLEKGTVVASARILRRKRSDWAQRQMLGQYACTDQSSGLARLKTQSRGSRRVETGAVTEVHQLEMKQTIVYTIRINRQLVWDAGVEAIGGGRGWACAGGRLEVMRWQCRFMQA